MLCKQRSREVMLCELSGGTGARQSRVTAGRGARLRDGQNGQCRGQGSLSQGRREEKGLLSSSTPWWNCSSFGPGLGSFRTFFPSRGAMGEERMPVHPALLPVPSRVSLCHLESLVVAFPSCSSTGFLLFRLPHCHGINGCRAHVVLGL